RLRRHVYCTETSPEASRPRTASWLNGWQPAARPRNSPGPPPYLGSQLVAVAPVAVRALVEVDRPSAGVHDGVLALRPVRVEGELPLRGLGEQIVRLPGPGRPIGIGRRRAARRNRERLVGVEQGRGAGDAGGPHRAPRIRGGSRVVGVEAHVPLSEGWLRQRNGLGGGGGGSEQQGEQDALFHGGFSLP